MKLYRIKVLHGGPKDSHESVETYLIAESDEQVLNWIRENKCYGGWWDDDEPEDEYQYYIVDDYEKLISFREWLLYNKGDLNDENGWEDAYYGVTKWGWELVADESYCIDLERLVDCGIAVKA